METFLMLSTEKKLKSKFGYEQQKDSIANDEPVLDDNGDVLKVTYTEFYNSRDIAVISNNLRPFCNMLEHLS